MSEPEKFAALIQVAPDIDPDSPDVQQLLQGAADAHGAVVVSDWERNPEPSNLDGVPHWRFECMAERA